MTETERLRAQLDDRGVEWDYGITGPAATRFNANGVDVTFTPILDGLVCSTILTPEQAIAVTLGAVHRKTHTKEYCNRCEGAVLPKWKKCPWCGEPLEEV